jgi:uncharacterized protein YwgA
MEDKAKLKHFLEFLKDRVAFNFDIKNFDHRIKLQKYVYLAREFGWNHNYRYNIYVRGPYSRMLADDYYDLDDVNPKYFNMDYDSFTNMIINKDTSWLEVAATMLSLYRSYSYHYSGIKLKTTILSRTKELKNSIPEEVICKVFDELTSEKLINFENA